MLLRRFGRLSKSRQRLFLVGVALAFAAAGAGLLRHRGPTPDGMSYLADAERQIKQGELSSAVIALRHAARAIPDNSDIRLRIAEVYLQLNQLAAAEAWARLAKQTGADESHADPVLAMALLQQNKLTTLIQRIQPGGRDPQDEADLRVSLALAHIYIGETRIGERLLDEARLRNPSTPRLAIGLARLALAHNDLVAAKAQLSAAQAAEPRSLETLRLESDVLRVGGDPDGAVAVLSKALQAYPDDLATIVARADLFIAKDRLDDAEKDVDHALQIAPSSLTPNLLRAILVARRGDFAKADELVMAMSQYFTSLPAGYFLQGIVKYAIGQYPIASDSLTRYLARRPDDAGALRLLALIAVHDGDYRRAIKLLQPVADADPTDSATIGVLARAYLADRRADAAVALYEKSAAAHPDDAKQQTSAALMQMRYGDPGAGFAALESIAKTNAGLEFAGPVVVLNDLKNGDVTKAAAMADALARQDADNPVVLNLQGCVRLAQFRFDDAAEIFALIVATDADFLTARRNLARTFLAMGRPKDAQRVYEELLRRQPKDLPALYALADLAVASHAPEDAAARLRQAIAAAPDNPEPGFRLAQIYAREKDWTRALRAAHDLVAHFPRDPQVVDLAASIRAASGDTAGAATEFYGLTQWVPRSSGILRRYAEYQRKAGDVAGARKSLVQALVLDPASMPAMTDLVQLDLDASGADTAVATARSFAAAQPVASDLLAADILARAGRRDEAIRQLADGQARHPSTDAVVRLAELTYGSGGQAAAKRLLQAWLEAHDDALAARLALANFAMLDRDHDAAQRLYEQIVQRFPSNVIALNNLAWLYARQHDPRANQLAQRAFRLAPDGTTADTLGWTLLSAGDARTALPLLETAGKAMPQDMAVQFHLALAFEATGDNRQARTLLERVVASKNAFDDRDDARRHLERLQHD
jgi:cellulose synthase operon protein C